MKKNLVRKQYLEKRKNLSNDLFLSLESKIILNTIRIIKELKPKTVHCYLPITNKHELNTELIFNYCWDNDIITVVPISDFKASTMETVVYAKNTELQISKFGIPEPICPISINNTDIDLIITPMLAFDKSGQRVGFGKGFYDRFFAECKLETQKIGISLFEPIDEIEDLHEHDFKLNKVITPNEVFSF